MVIMSLVLSAKLKQYSHVMLHEKCSKELKAWCGSQIPTRSPVTPSSALLRPYLGCSAE